MNRFTRAILLIAALLLFAGPAAALPNLTWAWPGTWSFPVVPRASLHTPPNVWLSDELEGNTATTYLNLIAINDGDVTTTPGVQGNFHVDGAGISPVAWSGIPAGSLFYAADRGPVVIRGGRHLLSAHYDVTGVVAESDETDNAWGRQFAWTPYVLGSSETVVRSEPPDPMGGWGDLGVPSTGYNCDGYGFTSSLQWTAVALSALDTAADYDLRLYEVPAIFDEAYSVPIASSSVGAGHLDFVLANRSQVGVTDYHVGVERYAGTGDYRVQEVHNWYVNIGDTYPTTLAQNEFLKIWQLTIAPGQTGPLLLTADAAPGSNFRLAVFDQALAVGGLLDAAAIEGSDEAGRLRLVHDFTAPGSYAVVVYRDPVYGTAPADFTLLIEDTVINYEPSQLATWHSPLTPRAFADATPAAAPLSSLLYSYYSPTYFNIAVLNSGLSSFDAVSVNFYRDGLVASPGNSFIHSAVGVVGPGGTATMNNLAGAFVPGGRHTWTLVIDPNDTVLETSEADNLWGEQFVWLPPVVGFDYHFSSTSLARFTDGWETINSGEVIYFNCDGYTLVGNDGYWNAAAVFHDPADDFDLQLYPHTTSSKQGFDQDLATSSLVAGYTDFVVVNRNIASENAYDVGVIRYEGEGTDYGLDVQQSTIVAAPTLAPIGPATLFDGEMIDIYDVWLEADVYSFLVENLAGDVDWGCQLLPHDVHYQSRFNHLGIAFDNGPGVNEWFSVTVSQAGWYGLVVYKSRVGDASNQGTYRVIVGSGGTAVDEGETPLAVDIAGVSPNPFNPRTEIAYEIPARGEVQLDVYDARGARIRRLIAGVEPAGRHVAVWDGVDDAGRRVASGVFVARLRANGVDVMRKLVMLK
jgi:hypothetical protein